MVELTACMKLCKYNLKSAFSLSRMDIYRNTSTIVFHCTYFTMFSVIEIHMDIVAESSHSFIDGIVQDLIHQMMQSIDSCASDVHTRSLPYSFKTFEHSNA